MTRTGERSKGQVTTWLAGVVCCAALLCLVGVMGCAGVAAAAEPASSTASGFGGEPLVVPGAQLLLGDEQEFAQQQAMRMNPVRADEREASRTSFDGYGVAQARALAGAAFPGVVDSPDGGVAQLVGGERITGYSGPYAAEVSLPGGKHGAIDSASPIAVQSAAGRWVPVDLGVREAGGVFEPLRADAQAEIPKRLSDGVRLSGIGVSLTPVDASGGALGAAQGEIDGTGVFYGSTEAPRAGVRDLDTLVKPTASGFEEYSLLRSQASPERLFFRVSLPAGARLVNEKDGSVRVLDEGTVLAVVSAPSATDAEGVQVPVSMKASSGDVLVVSVKHRSGDYRYPIAVDPTVKDEHIFYQKNWGFYNGGDSSFEGSGGTGGLQDAVAIGTGAGQRAFFYYPTQGESRIYAVTAKSSNTSANPQIEDVLSIWNVHSGSSEASQSWIGPYEKTTSSLCGLSGCATGSVNSSTDQTEVLYIQDTRETVQYLSSLSKLESAEVSIVQETGPTSSFVPIEHWVKPSHETVELELNATDPGIGIGGVSWVSSGWSGEKEGTNPFSFCSGVQCTACWTTSCSAGPLKVNLKLLPEGEDEITSTVEDPVKLTSTAKTKVKVDNAAPYNITLSGLPASGEIGFAHYLLKASATDGSGTTPSSGVASIALAIDGKTVGSPKGSCTPGPCTVSGEWTLNGEEYVAGKHVLKVTATDGAGNVETKEFTFVIESSETKPLGPGTVNLTSGEFGLSATDASIASPGSPLTIKRSYNSEHLTAGVEGPLGPQWSGLGLGGTQSLTVLPTGSLLLTAADGRQSLFAKEGTKFLAPPGDTNLTLKEEGTKIFKLTDQHGDVTTFTLPSGGSGTLLTPSSVEEAGSLGSTKSTFQTVGGITEPTQVLAPVPAGVSCTTLVKGCRALTFGYATSTTATGQNESQWGEYSGRLIHIYFTAWEPAKKEMATTTVAQYSYDSSGRLRAEWDPRIEKSTACGGTCTALKTTYGYDGEGHVVAMTHPGQETWAFTYNALTGDATTGRVIKAAQAPASAPSWNGEALSNTEVPKLSGSPTVGIRMTTSDGVWKNSPVDYSYQWEDCNLLGAECKAIYGAINPNYTPVTSDVGHTIVAVVTATNGDGALSASSAKSGVVRTPGAPEYISAINTGYLYPSNVLVNSKGVVFVLDEEHITELNENAELVKKFSVPGKPRSFAMDSKGNLWVASTDVKEYNEEGTLLAEYQKTPVSPCKELKSPAGIAIDKEGNIWVTNTGNNEIEELSSTGKCTKVLGKEGTGNGEYKSPSGIAIDSSSHIWVADKGNNRLQELEHTGVYKNQFATAGREFNFKEPTGLMIESKGNLWIADTGNYRVDEVSEEDKTLVTDVGREGEGKGRFLGPEGMALDLKSKLWVADAGSGLVEEFNFEYGKYEYSKQSGGDRLGGPRGVALDGKGHEWVLDEDAYAIEFNETGEYMKKFGRKGREGAGELYEPKSIAVDQKGNVWISEIYDRVQEFNEEGKYLSEFTTTEGVAGSLAFDSKGNIWAVVGEHAEQFNTEGKLLAQISGAGGATRPIELAVDSKNDIWVYYWAEGAPRLQKFTEKGELLVNEPEPFKYPAGGFATDAKNNLWITDGNVIELNEKGEYVSEFGSKGQGAGQFEGPSAIAIDSNSNMWVLESTVGDRVQHFSIVPTAPGEARSPAPGLTVSYRVPLSGTGAPYTMSLAETEKWAQKDAPSEATAIFPPDEPQGSPPTDYKRATIYYLDNRGRTVNVASPGGGIGTTEYNAPGDVVRSLSATDRASALGEGAKSAEVAKLIDTQSTYNEEGSEELTTLGPRHMVKLANGKEVQARAHTVYSYDEGAPSEGGPYRLPTKVAEGAQIEGEAEQEVRTSTTSYSGQTNLGWKLRKPTSVTVDPSGLKITHTTLYEASTGNAIETRGPKSTGAENSHDEKTVYYTTAANSSYPACGEHPEWANLICETLPGAQPKTTGLPELPVTTYSKFNIWDEAETTTETLGSTTRTVTDTYDAAGRESTASISSTAGTSLPTVTNEYNPETGVSAKQSTTVEGKTQSVSSVYNKLGQLTSYTDADGNVSTYEYEPGRGSRITKANDGKGVRTYIYDETTGAIKELSDSAAGKFTASYDSAGNLTSENYPNGMSANYTHNQLGEIVGLEYVKTTHCTEKCTWYSDKIVPSIHGQAMSQTSTLASQNYTYDNDGRLTQVQETPAGKGCVVRVYAYDEDTNRTSLTSREPGTEGKCAVEGGTVEKHTYDEADRLTDTGIGYDSFGDIAKLAAVDAGGSELTSTFYTDSRLANQTQAGETIGYQLDPTGRVRETVSTGKIVASVINHYATTGSAPAWTSETSGKWTRNIQGITSGLAAIQKNGETPVLQLTDLKGDIIATAAESETETKLLSTTRSTEYGVPTTETPPKYSWLGAHEIPTELPSGVVGMGARSYVPQLGRFLQTDPQTGGSANAYAYTYGDPVNSNDLSGEYTVGGPSQSAIEGTAHLAVEAAADQAAINAAIRAEAERKRSEVEAVASLNAGAEEEGEEEEGEEEEGEEEEAAYHPGTARAGLSLETGLFWQPLPENTSAKESAEPQTQAATPSRAATPCKEGQNGACTHYVGKKKKKRKKAAKAKYNDCTGPKNPKDSSEGCCVKGQPINRLEKNPAGEPCDVAEPKCTERACQPAYPNPGTLDCPDGSYPGVTYLGEPKCIPEGDYNPNEG